MTINVDEKKIVIARLQCMPASIKVSMGRFGSFNKDELIEHLKKGDEVGEFISEVCMEGIRTFKKDVEEHAR